ncbi:hypothetical protein VTI74DRAFT_9501 [Chaetomium olivicolor]
MLEAEGYTKRLDTLTLLRFLRARKFNVELSKQMFIDCEKWREETKLDETVPTWEYPEKEAMFKYYPQYYHKTDKVRFAFPHSLTRATNADAEFLGCRTAAPFTSSSSAGST